MPKHGFAHLVAQCILKSDSKGSLWTLVLCMSGWTSTHQHLARSCFLLQSCRLYAKTLLVSEIHKLPTIIFRHVLHVLSCTSQRRLVSHSAKRYESDTILKTSSMNKYSGCTAIIQYKWDLLHLNHPVKMYNISLMHRYMFMMLTHYQAGPLQVWWRPSSSADPSPQAGTAGTPCPGSYTCAPRPRSCRRSADTRQQLQHKTSIDQTTCARLGFTDLWIIILQIIEISLCLQKELHHSGSIRHELQQKEIKRLHNQTLFRCSHRWHSTLKSK